jgi:hypothetical protein
MKALKLTMVALLVLGVARAYADHTNVVQNLNIRLWGVQKGRTIDNSRIHAETVDVVRVDTRRVIQALGGATGQSFSSEARLVAVSPVGGGATLVEVRDGSVKVDVTSFFGHSDVSNPVDSSLLNKLSGRSSNTSYSIQQFSLQDSFLYSPLSLHFSVSGFTVEHSNSAVNGGQGGLDADVSGWGDREGNLMIFRGSISVRGRETEVVPDDDGGIVS